MVLIKCEYMCIQDESDSTFSSDVKLVSSPNVIRISVCDDSDSNTKPCNCICGELSQKLDEVMSELRYLRSLRLEECFSVFKSLLKQQVSFNVHFLLITVHSMACHINTFKFNYSYEYSGTLCDPASYNSHR